MLSMDNDSEFWGAFCGLLILIVFACLLLGCAQPVPAQIGSFKATCALVVIGQNEQGITFVKQACEVE